ncbi:MAG TPA: glycoside hydrolase family 15 protein, partial [Lacisediminihabitans sp.]|uniref:glycoside hydrolase family 15 protein n=1 Tax=Lacisediminihabitans sp. TaxID=2787631 RepID=UPI002ED86208
RVEGISGTVDMRWSVTPGSMLNSASPWVERTIHGPVIRVNGVMLGVQGLDHGPNPPSDRRLDGAFTAAKGSRHLIVVSATEREPLRVLTPAIVDRGIDRTIANWRAWSKEFSFDGDWAEVVHRSALALKLLIHSPNGSISAAATTSLPESWAGGKNWDYRFAWVRDLAYTVHALIRFGLREETHAAVSWLLTTIRVNGPDLFVFYALDGGPTGGVAVADAPGWRGIGPVVSGNRAKDQLQLGVYGDLFDVVRSYVDDGNVLDADTGRLLASIADRACDSWRRPDSGMWELTEQRHYTSSKLGCWQALDCAVRLAELGQIPGGGERWAAERDRIRDWVRENCWSESRQSYVWYPGSDELDASILLHAPSGFDRGERMSRTIDAIQAELGRGPLVYRYSGMQAVEGTFVACGFWMVSALACVGRMDEARARMDELIALANDVGLYSEMMDAETHEFLGNLPQGLSHLALINAALTVEELGGGR